MPKCFFDRQYGVSKKKYELVFLLARLKRRMPRDGFHALKGPFCPKTPSADRPLIGLTGMQGLQAVRQRFGFSDNAA